MDVRSVQRLLLASGYYKGGVDGIPGERTTVAVNKLISKHAGGDLLPIAAARWPFKRRMIAAAQLVLHFAGYEPGIIDGFAGHNTMNALRAWDHFQTTGKFEEIPRPVNTQPSPASHKFPLQRDCTKFYGPPGSKELESKLTYIDPQYPMRLDWSLTAVVKNIRIHEKCAESASKALREIYTEYGTRDLRRLGLDRFAGSYAPRRMRGSKSWSMHAYGCAIDFYAQPNGLTTRCPDALFCGKDYVKFFDIWEANGWVSLGRAIGRDWMHVQAARLT